MGNTKSFLYRQRFGYGLGDFACNLIWQMISLYLLYFYTDVMKLNAASIGVMFIVCRIIDAVTDVLVGFAIDKTRTRCLYLFAAMTTEEGKISANVFVKPENVPDDTFLFEYSLFFISTLYDLHQAHPDEEMVRELYPTAKKQMNITLKMFDENGKLNPDENYPVFVDWSNDFNKDTAGQAEMIYVMKQFIELAKVVRDSEISIYEKKLELITDYAKNVLFRPEKNLFATAWDEYNIASQVWMVLAHVMSDEENKSIMQTTIQELFPVKNIATPYMYHHIVEALFEAGLDEEAIHLMKSYWGKMISLGADTYWEAFDPDQPEYSPYGSPIVNSYCHAWSCTPVYLLKKYVKNK